MAEKQKFGRIYLLNLLAKYKQSSGGRSSVGRARDCDSRGRGFNPRRSPHFPVNICDKFVAVPFTAASIATLALMFRYNSDHATDELGQIG